MPKTPMPEAARREFDGMTDAEATEAVVTGVLEVALRLGQEGKMKTVDEVAELISYSLEQLGFHR
jgi:hypothetical protein